MPSPTNLLPTLGRLTRLTGCIPRSSVALGAQRWHSSPPIGVQAALAAAKDKSITPQRTIFNEFSLKGRVAVVTGGKQGLGLEMSMALAEAGASVYCLDLPPTPTVEFEKTKEYISQLGGAMHYRSVDVTKQQQVWDAVESIATDEGRMDVAIAAAGILHGAHCLEYKDVDFQRVRIPILVKTATLNFYSRSWMSIRTACFIRPRLQVDRWLDLACPEALS